MLYKLLTNHIYLQEENWVEVDGNRAHGPYAIHEDQWVSYDDMNMVSRKAEYIIDNDFGGAMIWALDLDDFNNICGCGKYPLLKTVSHVVRGVPTIRPICNKSSRLYRSEDDLSFEGISISVSEIDI